MIKLKYVGGDSDYDEDFTPGELYDAVESPWGSSHYDVTDNFGEIWMVKVDDEYFVRQ